MAHPQQDDDTSRLGSLQSCGKTHGKQSDGRQLEPRQVPPRSSYRPSQQIKEKHRLAMQQAITWRVDDHTPCVNQVLTIDMAPRLKLGAVLPPEA